MSPTETHEVGSGFRAVLHGVFVLYAVVSPAVALLQCFAGASQCWPGLCCAEQNVLPQLLGTPHTAVSILGIALQHFWHEACPVHVCVARNPPQGYGTGTGVTSNLSAGLNSHFSAPLSFAFSRANSLGQCSFTADCGCI